jgi:hypothetical protein
LAASKFPLLTSAMASLIFPKARVRDSGSSPASLAGFLGRLMERLQRSHAQAGRVGEVLKVLNTLGGLVCEEDDGRARCRCSRDETAATRERGNDLPGARGHV